MTGDAMSELFKLLNGFQPEWVFAILVGLVIAYRLPLIIKELFAGARGFLMAWRRNSSRSRSVQTPASRSE